MITVIASRMSPERSSSHVSRSSQACSAALVASSKAASDAGGGSRPRVAQHSQRSEREGDHGRHDRRRPEAPLVLHLSVAEDGDYRREADEGEAEPDQAPLAGAEGERAPDPTQEPGER